MIDVDFNFSIFCECISFFNIKLITSLIVEIALKLQNIENIILKFITLNIYNS